jgi:hypothetical protein
MPIVMTRDAPQANCERITFTGINPGDTADGVLISGTAGAIGAVQVHGTLGGATIALQVSNDNVNFFNLTDAGGTAITFTAAGLRDFSTAAAFIRPSITGGTGSNVTVTVVLRT